VEAAPRASKLDRSKPAIVNLTVHDQVQLDRVTRTSAERYGDLLPPGTTPVHLAAGTYVFRTTGDAHVQLGEDTPVHVLAVTLRRSPPEDQRPRRVGRLSRPRARAARSPPRHARPQRVPASWHGTSLWPSSGRREVFQLPDDYRSCVLVLQLASALARSTGRFVAAA
jgi:hypothetical protein